jgi:hypothetical protein
MGMAAAAAPAKRMKERRETPGLSRLEFMEGSLVAES